MGRFVRAMNGKRQEACRAAPRDALGSGARSPDVMIVRRGGSGAADSHHDVRMTDSGSGGNGGSGSGSAPDGDSGRWNFRLGFGPFAPTRPDDANYVAYMRLKTAPPDDCQFLEDYGVARLECSRPGANRFAAIGQLVREIRTDYGLVGTDSLGIQKLWEWVPHDREWAECIAAQLLLMGASRAEQLGVGVEDVVALVRAAMTPRLPRRRPGSSKPGDGHAAGRPASGSEAATPDSGRGNSIHRPGSRKGTNPAPE
jgi:hypothetical protein